MGGSARALRSIAVAGAGIVGLSAALAFARALPRARVKLLALPADPAALADRMPTSLPSVAPLHAAIGLTERELVARGVATHHLGSRFAGWSADGAPWVYAFGAYGQPNGRVPFDQLWVRAHQKKRALPYDRYSVAARLIERGRFVLPGGDPGSPFSTFSYGLRLDPQLYRARLEKEARAAGIDFIEAELAGVERRQDGGVASLALTDGRRLEADLFLDCAGPAARLLGQIDDSFEDWSGALPCDRLRLGVGPGPAVPAPSDRFSASGDGWRAAWPLRGRVLHGFAFASATGEGEAPGSSGDPNAELLTVRPGRRLRPWVHNVLALGDAAFAVDPLQGLNLDLAQRAILLALELLPGRDCHPLELREYNRRTALATTRVRDFLALHYFRSGRTDGALWSGMAGRQLPDSLARTLDQYEARGRLPYHEEETVPRDGWAAVLLGMGVLPRAVDPLAAGVSFDRSLEAMERIARQADQIAGGAPPYAACLAQLEAAG